MTKIPLAKSRRWFVIGFLAIVGISVFWTFSPGMPVLIGPWAWASDKKAGQELFEHEWQPNDALARGDGLGPVFNGTSCVACHNQGGSGGGGDNSHNVRNFEVFPSARDAQLHTGTIHSFAIDAGSKESFDQVRSRYPIIKGSTRTETRDHCSYTVRIPDVDPLQVDTVQTTALFGAGWIDRISAKAITSARRNYMLGSLVKELGAEFDAIPPGRVRILPDGRVGKFGWKAQFATLEEFVAAACANEVGLGTPISTQAQPFPNPAYPEQKPDLNRKQFGALVAFVSTLPKPIEATPASADEQAQAVRGKEMFHSTGCAICHIPNMGGVKGVYSDFLMHRLQDPQGNGGSSYGPPRPDTPLPDNHPSPEDWRTPPLWGVADSAPYLHDGTAANLFGAIQAHSGDAKIVRDRFNKLGGADQQAVIAFLNTLKAPTEAKPVQTARK